MVGTVVASDAIELALAAELLERLSFCAGPGLSGHVSQASLEAIETAFEGVFLCMEPFFTGAGVACAEGMPSGCSAHAPSGLSSGMREGDLCCAVGERSGLVVFVETLAVVEPREVGRSELLLPFFCAVLRFCAEFLFRR